jgi:hypothetical protein
MYTDDIDAFVFNMAHKYIPSDRQKAIYTWNNGFCFGNAILSVKSDTSLNQHNQGYCNTGKQWYYDIEGDVSPLTNQKGAFTCAQLEVYKIIY